MANNKNNKKGNKNLEVKVNMEEVLKGVKVIVKEKKKEVALRTAVGVSKALPEGKAILRNVALHLGVELGKAMTEAIVGENNLTDGVSNFAHAAIATNTTYNTVVGINNFNKGYKKATKEDVLKVFAPALEAAKRYEEKEEDEAEEVETTEEEVTVNEEVVEEEVDEDKAVADAVRALTNEQLSSIYNNYSNMVKKIEELTKKLDEADEKVKNLEKEKK